MKRSAKFSYALKRTAFVLDCCPATARKLGDAGVIECWRDERGWRWFVEASVLAERARRLRLAHIG